MKLEDLSPEQVAKAEACQSVDEALAFVKEEGFELTDEQMELIAGGKHGRSGEASYEGFGKMVKVLFS